MNSFFLAAGLGARLKPLTEKFPKPCVPFLNVPLGLYQFRYLTPALARICVANTYHLAAKVHQLYSQQTYLKNRFLFSDETTLLGSAGGLKKAAVHFDPQQTILMMNADEIYFAEDNHFIEKALQQHELNNNLATLICMKHPEVGQKFGGIWCDGLRVKDIGKSPVDPTLQPHHYIGMVLLHPRVLALIPDDLETNIFYDILIQQLQSDRVEIFNIQAEWFETGNPVDYLLATQATLQNLQPETLDFINHYDPSRLVRNSNGCSLISNSVQIDASRLFGFNVISKSTNPKTLLSLGRIENSVLFENEVINLDYFKA